MSGPQTKPEIQLLAGKTAWLITEGKAGMDVAVRGVADALGLRAVMKHVAPSGAFRFLAPYAPTNPREKFGTPGTPFAPPWPEVAIATGRQSIPYLKALKRRAGLSTYTIVLLDPKTGAATADLIWVPEHDRRRGANVITTLTTPHSFSQARIAGLRAHMPPAIAALQGPRVAVILGGTSKTHTFTEACTARLAGSLASLARHGASFMITPSRRTPAAVTDRVDAATAHAPRILWRGEGANPYADFLAHADVLVVTADSANMCGEAAATGKPVYVFHPSGGSAKFDRFHAALVTHGAARPLPESVERLETWTYAPLDAASLIAADVERRYRRRHNMLKRAE